MKQNKKKITVKDIEKMPFDEFIKREYEWAADELTKMGIFEKAKKKNENK